ncbi:MAG: hypothetical protein Q9183_000645 [Haloplaca sp. 2 TL-2023]
MAQDVSPPDAVHWSDPSMFGLNTILDFAPPSRNDSLYGMGTGNGTTVDNSKPAIKQLACARCHNQKLRCVRSAAPRDANGSCHRCLSAGTECINRQPHRIGRPVDHVSRLQTPGGHSTGNKGAANRPYQNRGDFGNDDVDESSPRTAQRRWKNTSASSNPSCASATFTHPYAAGPDLDRWPWPSPPQEPASMDSAATSGGGNHGDSLTSQITPFGRGFEPGIGLGGGNNRLTAQDDFLTVGLEDTNTLLRKEFDDLPTNFLSGTQAGSDGEVLLEEDPVELLSRLHLELYQCLTTVRLVDKQKKERVRDKSAPTGAPISTNWSEQLFRTTEQFIAALKSYINCTPAPLVTPSCSSTGLTDDDGSSLTSTGTNHVGSGDNVVQVDSATGLLIVSCYMRLMEILGVVVFIVETFTKMDCPGSYVQIRFGAFIPKTDKALHARMLGQYVLYLLDSITEAVNSAVASRQPYAKAIVDVRQAEAKLKERLMTILR